MDVDVSSCAKVSACQTVSRMGQPFVTGREGDKPSLGVAAPQELQLQTNANQKSGDPRVRDVISAFNKAPTPIVLGNSPVDQRRTRYVFLLDDSRSTSTVKESPSGRSGGNLDLMIKHDDRLMEKMEESNRRANEEQEGDFSDGGSEGSLDDVRQHPGIIKVAKSDDHEYLTLYEAHLSRLEEVGNTSSEHLMAATAQQTFVAQQGFEQKEVQSSARSSGNVTQAEFTSTSLPHGIVVTPSTISHSVAQHSTLPQTTVTLAVQAPQIQQNQSLQQTGTAQIIAASVISPEEFQANAAISKEGFTTGDVQYVEATAEHALYPNGTGSNAFHYNDNTMFTQQASATAYMDAAAQPQQAQTFSAVNAAVTPTVVTAANTAPATYAQVAGQQPQSIARHPIAHTTRASPATVQWLLENYETAEGVSLPRSTLYNHYLTHCQTHKLDPVNAASFGKLIRSVFLGLRTRRLGTRGNSKYHYYGIRIKPNSPLNALTDDSQVALRQSPSTQKRLKPARLDGSEGPDGYSSSAGGSADPAQQSQHHQHQQYLGDITQGLPDFEDLDTKGAPLPDGIHEEDLDTFQDMYREHCEAFLDVVVNLQFAVVESLWQSFWRHTSEPGEKKADEEGGQLLSTSPQIKELGDDEDNEKRLPKSKLMILCEYEPVIAYTKSCDHLLYQTLVEILIPDVLRPIPSSLTQAIRNFAKRLEGWVVGSLNHVPKKMGTVKVSTCCAFAQTLRRYTSLNHLAQAARAVLQNPSQISQMLSDLNRVDFANVQEQAAWVCQCDDHLVYRIEQDFKLTLQQQNSLEQWATWLEGVVDQFLKPQEGGDGYPKAAKQFLLKWSFYSSMIIRDLTLRSAASFGSFHLIRLLYDEYMFYLVEHKVSKAIGASPISVMGEYVGLGSALAMGLDAVENSLLGNQNGENDGNLGDLLVPPVPSSESVEPEPKRARPS